MNTPAHQSAHRLEHFLNCRMVCKYTHIIFMDYGLNSPTACVTRWWAGRDNAILTEPTSSRANCLKTRRLPPVGCTLCVRPVRPKLPARAGDGRRRSLTFVTAYPCRSMIPQKRRAVSQHPRQERDNSCLPGERETAPSLGVRLVNAGRKREEKPRKSNRMTGLAGKATMDKTTKGALRCRHARTSQSRMTGWPKKG